MGYIFILGQKGKIVPYLEESGEMGLHCLAIISTTLSSYPQYMHLWNGQERKHLQSRFLNLICNYSTSCTLRYGKPSCHKTL